MHLSQVVVYLVQLRAPGLISMLGIFLWRYRSIIQWDERITGSVTNFSSGPADPGDHSCIQVAFTRNLNVDTELLLENEFPPFRRDVRFGN